MSRSRSRRPKSTRVSKIKGHPAERLLAAWPQGDWWTLRFDGGCNDNGQANATGRWAYHLLSPEQTTSAMSCGKATGDLVTCNTAEWEACLAGVRRAAAVGLTGGLLIEGDSDLVVKQLSGWWMASGALVQFRDEALDLLAGIGLPWHARWIPRAENAFCDSMTH